MGFATVLPYGLIPEHLLPFLDASDRDNVIRTARANPASLQAPVAWLDELYALLVHAESSDSEKVADSAVIRLLGDFSWPLQIDSDASFLEKFLAICTTPRLSDLAKRAIFVAVHPDQDLLDKMHSEILRDSSFQKLLAFSQICPKTDFNQLIYPLLRELGGTNESPKGFYKFVADPVLMVRFSDDQVAEIFAFVLSDRRAISSSGSDLTAWLNVLRALVARHVPIDGQLCDLIQLIEQSRSFARGRDQVDILREIVNFLMPYSYTLDASTRRHLAELDRELLSSAPGAATGLPNTAAGTDDESVDLELFQELCHSLSQTFSNRCCQATVALFEKNNLAAALFRYPVLAMFAESMQLENQFQAKVLLRVMPVLPLLAVPFMSGIAEIEKMNRVNQFIIALNLSMMKRVGVQEEHLDLGTHIQYTFRQLILAACEERNIASRFFQKKRDDTFSMGSAIAKEVMKLLNASPVAKALLSDVFGLTHEVLFKSGEALLARMNGEPELRRLRREEAAPAAAEAFVP